MNLRIIAACCVLMASPLSSAALEFSEPLTIASSDDGVFYHLDSSGSRVMASNRGTLALVWEDNANGSPTVRVAFRERDAAGFSPPLAVSGPAAAYEPVIAACGDGFLIGWESADRLWLRFVSPRGMQSPVRLSDAAGRQISLAQDRAGGTVAVWSEKNGSYFQIAQAVISGCGRSLRIDRRGWVDRSADKTQQGYPAVAVTARGTLVAWEDRRAGATRIFTAIAAPGKSFSAPRLLNEFMPSPRPEYGKGTGAMRVVLSSDRRQTVVAVWMDKRSFEGGYDVYAAVSDDGGNSFRPNERVQDDFGDNIPQWHASVAISREGRIIVAWDDTRDDTPDIWFSERTGNGQWSDDENWPDGAGRGAQSYPVLLFDERGLHAVWLDRDGQHQALRYLFAR